MTISSPDMGSLLEELVDQSWTSRSCSHHHLSTETSYNTMAMMYNTTSCILVTTHSFEGCEVVLGDHGVPRQEGHQGRGQLQGGGPVRGELLQEPVVVLYYCIVL